MAKKLLLVGILIAFSLFWLVFGRVFRVPTASMEPTIPAGSWVLANLCAYKGKAPARFEIVVYAPPKKAVKGDQRYLGTVIGLPGETIELDQSGVVKINGDPIAAPSKILYRSVERGAFSGPFNRLTLKADEYFMLGDNTANAFDCRFFGPIQKSAILGKAWSVNGKSVP